MKKKTVDLTEYDPIQRLNEVDSAVQVPPDIELDIRRVIRRDTIKKGALLLEMNTVCDRIWFIEKGLFRSYKKIKGSEENTWFMKENDLMTDPKSFHSGEPSKHNICAMETSIVHSISRQQINNFCIRSHAFEHICHLLTWEYYTKFMDYWDELTSGTIRQRYHHYLIHFPYLNDRISVDHIASLLKCSSRSIRRVRENKP
ncbi:MAG TPA: cyclic nucleotide-binding domain-containing protein [Puia sp.]|nr:cyclic nucleotide-binding domain-containing protein [Puia sp.]